jgi:pimeloyl-ACP methyl ester carboxylesterase
MKWIAGVLVTLAVVGLVLLGARPLAIGVAEKQLMELHPKGAATPASFGAAFYQDLTFNSGGRRLDASIVRAAADCPSPTAILIFHGKGETVTDWARAQAFLAGQCVSSMVFDYSGHGASAPPASIAHLNADAAAAWPVFAHLFPRPARRCILAHSMGNSPMLHAYPAMSPAPDCVVDANGFTSLAKIAGVGGAPAPLLFLLSGVWDNEAAIKAVRSPLLVIHSDADTTIPPAMGAELAAAAPAGATVITVHGYGHDALYEAPASGWWTPVLKFVRPLAAGRPNP